MRIYFLSYKPAILKLNGLYAGGVDLFERHIEVDLADNLFVEIAPGGNLLPASFFLNADFLSDPPEFIDVYLLEGDALIYVKRFANADSRLNVIFQTRFEGNLITVYSQGEIYLSAEGADCSVTPLGASFARVESFTERLAGFPVLALRGGDKLAVISAHGELIFLNAAESFGFGDSFKISTRFETCAAVRADCEFSYDGRKLTPISCRTTETHAPDPRIMHFAFFESVLTRGDYSRYLCGELLPHADKLKEYLGDFSGVTVPTEKFYATHPGVNAAGLVYAERKNLFRIKYFAVGITDGKISNVYPVE